MSEYLRKASELIDKAVKARELSNRSYGDHHNEEIRLRAATAYAMLAAIEKGLLPEPIAEQVYDQFKTLTSR